MMKRSITIGLLVLFICIFCSPTFCDSWLNLYDIQDPDYLRIVPAQDGVYVAGLTAPIGDPTLRFWILRLNSDGSVAWKKNFAGSEESEPSLFPYSIIPLHDGSVLVWAAYNGANWPQGVMKINDSGEIVWQHAYGEDFFTREFSIDTITENSDGTFTLMGTGLIYEYTFATWIAQLSANGVITSQRLLDQTVNQRGSVVSLSISDGVMVGGGKCDVQGSSLDCQILNCRCPPMGNANRCSRFD